jgi:serine/threonine protein kinase
MIDVARGMNFLHAQDPVVIHRDLKSHNLLVSYDWTTKVCDFGISRVKEKTQMMSQVGTPQVSDNASTSLTFAVDGKGGTTRGKM